jgi:ABC-2 type transport system ATP-binding protein
MSLMADELVVIGRGKMIDNGPVDGFVKRFTQTTVLVRTPAANTLGEILRREGADVEPLPDGALIVSGADASAVGELAHRDGIVLHELATQSASLEQAFMSATGESEEFVAHEFVASVTAPADEIAPEAEQGPDDQRGGVA